MSFEGNYNETLLNREPAAANLVQKWRELQTDLSISEVSIYHQFPLYPTNDGDSSVQANILVLTKEYGAFVFQAVTYSGRPDWLKEDSVDNLREVDHLLFAKIFKDSPDLRLTRRELKVSILPVLFIYNPEDIVIDVNELSISSLEVASNYLELKDLILSNDALSLSDEDIIELKATIEGSKGIIKPSSRNLSGSNTSTRGAILSKIEQQIFNFDLQQKRAALFTLDGPQRIRGLAGSGKTVILAMKAALIHLQYPDAKILYTYYTKALQGYIRRLIVRFYRQFAEQDPNWDKIDIIHAWGGRSLEGVYYNTCLANGVSPMSLTDAQSKNSDNPFGYICELLNEKKLKIEYDYSLLDEAQDFPTYFYRVCRQITRSDRVVWAYDDFQNILNINIQNERETFGKNEDGEYYIDFSRHQVDLQDIILYKCYRNPRKVLLAAFALGLGIYNNDGNGEARLIQRLENNDHWESLGFSVDEGSSSVGDHMKISRPHVNSPHLKNTLLESGETVKVLQFESVEEECKEVARLISEDLKSELNPEDIAVVCLDNRYVKNYFKLISESLSELDVKCFNLLRAPSVNVKYHVKGHVTLSTIYKAKGNESGSVYAIGVDSVFHQKDDIVERNKLFTAMTRSLAWVTISGVGMFVNFCISEVGSLIENNYQLNFIQPSEEDVRTIRQDLSNKQAALNKIERYAESLARELGLTKEEVINQLNAKISRK